jgi:hypothetical protein
MSFNYTFTSPPTTHVIQPPVFWAQVNPLESPIFHGIRISMEDDAYFAVLGIGFIPTPASVIKTTGTSLKLSLSLFLLCVAGRDFGFITKQGVGWRLEPISTTVKKRGLLYFHL